MSRKDLSARQYLIKQDGTRGLISYNGRLIHDGGMPLNEIYWSWMKSVDDKSINMINLRFIEYCEIINESVRPFKKD
jgi:hypothetical protein